MLWIKMLKEITSTLKRKRFTGKNDSFYEAKGSYSFYLPAILGRMKLLKILGKKLHFGRLLIKEYFSIISIKSNILESSIKKIDF